MAEHTINLYEHGHVPGPQGLETLTGLQILDVSSNRLARVAGLSTLTALTDLWLNDNAIADLGGVERVLGSTVGSTLSCLYLAGNPCAGEPGYSARLHAALPALTALDS